MILGLARVGLHEHSATRRMNGVRGCSKAPVRRKWVQSAALWSDDLAIAEWWAVALPLINLLKTGISVTSGDLRLELSCSVAVQAEFNDGTLSMIGSANLSTIIDNVPSLN